MKSLLSSFGFEHPSKRRRAIQQKTHAAGIARLSRALVEHALSWLNLNELAKAQDCKLWNELPLESLWKSHYIRQFEEGSVNDPTVTTNRVKTAWRQRFRNRLTARDNRLLLTCAQVFSKIRHTSDSPTMIVGATSSLLVHQRVQYRHLEHAADPASSMTTVTTVCSLPHCTEVYRLETAQCAAVVADGLEAKLALAVWSSKLVELRQLQTGKLIRSWSCSFDELALTAGTRLLAMWKSTPDENGRRKFVAPGNSFLARLANATNSNTTKVKTRLLAFDMAHDSAQAETLSEIDDAACRVTQDESHVLVVGSISAEVWRVELEAGQRTRMQQARTLKLHLGEPMRMELPAGDHILRVRSEDGQLQAISKDGVDTLKRLRYWRFRFAAPLEDTACALFHEPALDVYSPQRGIQPEQVMELPDGFRLVALNWRYFIFRHDKEPSRLLLLDFAEPNPGVVNRCVRAGRAAVDAAADVAAVGAVAVQAAIGRVGSLLGLR